MTRDQAKEELKGRLKEYVNQITEPDRRAGRNMYKCPLCNSGHGSGRNSNGAFTVAPNGLLWRCFSCEKSGDIFNLYAYVNNLDVKSDFAQILDSLAALFNITIDNVHTEYTQKEKPQRGATMTEEKKPEPKADYSDYIAACKAAVGQTDYLKSRGFTEATIERFSLGYDAAKRAIVIPYNTNGSYYITRSVEDKRFYKPKSEEAGAEPVYNKPALYSPKPCFICESPIDAISIMQAGGNAVALGGTGTYKLIDAIKEKEPAAMLILSLDNDEKGETAAARAAEELTALNVPFTKATWTIDAYPEEQRKDANDFLRGNAAQLKADVEDNAGRAYRLQHAEEAEQKEAYSKLSGAGRLEALKAEIRANAARAYTPTGFKALDAELDGGLYPGLYILGAVSSLGKTTLALQIADNIAKAGDDVLIFSLEMAAGELMAKSISRLTYELCNGVEGNAKTVRGYTTYKRYQNYSKAELELISEAEAAYSSYAEHLYYKEGLGNIGAEEIKQAVKHHIAITGNKPIVVIDYLQILAPADVRASDKQNTDKAILELKRLSRDYGIAVIGISSFNRDNYTAAASMAAFKESGAIEYGSDVLLALQPVGMEEASTATKQAANKKKLDDCKASSKRAIEAVILKNRNGKTGGKVGFNYSAMFNCFEEDDNGLKAWRDQEAASRL